MSPVQIREHTGPGQVPAMRFGSGGGDCGQRIKTAADGPMEKTDTHGGSVAASAKGLARSNTKTQNAGLFENKARKCFIWRYSFDNPWIGALCR
jgi:hypothetical protein